MSKFTLYVSYDIFDLATKLFPNRKVLPNKDILPKTAFWYGGINKNALRRLYLEDEAIYTRTDILQPLRTRKVKI